MFNRLRSFIEDNLIVKYITTYHDTIKMPYKEAYLTRLKLHTNIILLFVVMQELYTQNKYTMMLVSSFVTNVRMYLFKSHKC